MSRIVTRQESGRLCKCVISDTHCNNATQQIIDFCGLDIVKELDRKTSTSKTGGAIILFEKEGSYYQAYKGHNTSKLPGNYTYNVYLCNGGKRTKENLLAVKKKGTTKKKTRQKSARISTSSLASVPATKYCPNPQNRLYLGKKLGNLIDNCYLENDREVIEHYNNHITDKSQLISFAAIFEQGLMGEISSAIFVLCNANSGLDENDYKVLLDPDMIALAKNIRESREKTNILLSIPARRGNYPLFQWANKHICKKDFWNFLKNELKLSNNDNIYDWLSQHFAMRDVFNYHSHALNMRQWEASCQEIFHRQTLPHQDITIEELRQAMAQEKPIILAMGRNTWLKYLPELKNYKYTFVLRSYSWFTKNNIFLYQDFCKLANHTKKQIETMHEKAWNTLVDLMRKQIKANK